jgi:hypothetical protein
MDAREFFQTIVVPNYNEFVRTPNNVRLLWNAIVSMNTVPEYLVLDRLGYALEVYREELTQEAQKIRNQLGLTELQYCANTFKHVRKIPRGQSTATASSTSVEPIDQATWKIGDSAFATVNSLPGLKPVQ